MFLFLSVQYMNRLSLLFVVFVVGLFHIFLVLVFLVSLGHMPLQYSIPFHGYHISVYFLYASVLGNLFGG